MAAPPLSSRPSPSPFPSNPQQTPAPQPDAERDVLKRTYLTLLPPTQLLELCLAFEAHVPLTISSSFWPSDLKAAIAGLQHPYAASTSEPPLPPPSAQNHSAPPAPPPPPLVQKDEPPMASLREDEPPQQPRVSEDVLRSLAAVLNAASASASNRDSSQANVSTQTTPQPPPATSSFSPQPAASSSTEAPYAQTPYNYAQQPQPSSKQPAYPHSPYYSHPGYSSHYPYPYPPAYGSSQSYGASSSQQPQAGPSRPPQRSRYPASTSKEPVKDHTEDLPSYEDMIVEALLDINDPEGCVPKTLFQWMAEHYPVQSNFRPSASQALQKAFKRGRLEKSATGRYKININWDGGSTSSRRATRRPQSSAHHTMQQSQHARQNTPSSSPFTHAPLPHRSSPAPTPQAHQQTPPQTYSYPYSYPGYHAYPPPTQKSSASASPSRNPSVAPTTKASSSSSHPPPSAHSLINGAAAAAGGKEKQTESSGNDAWQLLYNLITNGGAALPSQPSALSAPQPPLAGSSIRTAGGDLAGGSILSDEDRAALQAQLVLLAAQLQAIEEGEDEDEDEDEDKVDQSGDPLLEALAGLGSTAGVGGSQTNAGAGKVSSVAMPNLPSTDNDMGTSGNPPSPSAVAGGTTPSPMPTATGYKMQVDEPVMGSLGMDTDPAMDPLGTTYNADDDDDDDDDMEMVL